MAKENAPSDQFYWADLTRDTGMLSPAAHGAWCRFLAMTWFTKPRGWFKGDLAAYARMFGSTSDHADALLREILRYNVGSLGTEADGIRGFVEVWDGDAITDCHGNVTLVNRRKFREWQEQEANRLRKDKSRHPERYPANGGVSQDCHTIVTSLSSSSASSSTSDLNRLIDCVHACVRENPDKDSRLVEIAVIETMLRRKGSANEHKPIKSMRYFDEEIMRMAEQGSTLGSNAIDALLHRRREQIGVETV